MTKKLDSTIVDILNRPLPEEALKYMEFSKLTSIKPIFVTERLNEAFGVGGWILENEVQLVNGNPFFEISGNMPYVGIIKTIFTVPEFGIKFECIASSTNKDIGDALKGAISDNTTKIASWLGIGADVFKGKHGAPAKKEGLHPKHIQWDNIKAELKSQNTTIEEVKNQYTISPAVERLLTK